MNHDFLKPKLDLRFETNLRQEVISQFEKVGRRRWFQSWQMWLPVAFSLAAVMMVMMNNYQVESPTSRLSGELDGLEQELTQIEQQLIYDQTLIGAIEFTNL